MALRNMLFLAAMAAGGFCVGAALAHGERDAWEWVAAYGALALVNYAVAAIHMPRFWRGEP